MQQILSPSDGFLDLVFQLVIETFWPTDLSACNTDGRTILEIYRYQNFNGIISVNALTLFIILVLIFITLTSGRRICERNHYCSIFRNGSCFTWVSLCDLQNSQHLVSIFLMLSPSSVPFLGLSHHFQNLNPLIP